MNAIIKNQISNLKNSRAYNRTNNQIVPVNRLWENFDIGYGYITGYQLFYGYG